MQTSHLIQRRSNMRQRDPPDKFLFCMWVCSGPTESLVVVCGRNILGCSLFQSIMKIQAVAQNTARTVERLHIRAGI